MDTEAMRRAALEAALTTREELLAALDDLRGEIERVVAAAGEERASRPGAFDGWSLKDVVAHLTGWRLMTAARLEAGLTGIEPAAPWPAHLHEDDDTDAINAWFYETSRDKPLEQVMRESRETFDRCRRAIAALPEEALFQPGHFPWLGAYALGPAVVSGTVMHYHEEHEPAVRAWLAST